jgi:hypothetical protein
LAKSARYPQLPVSIEGHQRRRTGERMMNDGLTRILSRAGLLPARTGTTAYRLTPEATDGPIEVAPELVRHDLAEGAPGVPLMLRVRIVDAATRHAVPGALLDVAHRPASHGPTPRAVQVSDEDGEVRFRTVFPGRYAHRAVHLQAEAHAGGAVRHTGRFFFDDELTGRIVGLPPYRDDPTVWTPNAEDLLFDEGGLLAVVPRDRYDLPSGLLASITVAVDRQARPQ